MPIRLRLELLQWASEASDRFRIEDDYDSEFRFNGKPLPTLFSGDSSGKVIYVNTFSKTISPSFRISYMVLPAGCRLKIFVFFCPNIRYNICMVNNSTAYLSNSGIFSFFKFGDVTLKFRTSSKLKEYKSIENWDNGYLVVMADYDKLGITEEYVDITNVLNELHFNSKQFLEPIKKVEIRYE